MELRQLKYFVRIAETGRFSDASRQLFISQSAISQQIKALEEELGAQLFVRLPHKVTLTESGETLLPMARQILRGVTDCYERLADLKGLLCGELNVGLTYTFEPYMREAMLHFMKQYPKVQINAHYKNLPELLKKLRDRELDMMLSVMPTSPHEFVESEFFAETSLGAVMRKNHPLADRKKLSFRDFGNYSLILPERGIRDRNAIESYIHKDTGKLNVRSWVTDPNALLNIIQESNFVTFLSEGSIVGRSLLSFIPIVELGEPLKVYAHFNKEVTRKHSAEVFLKMLRETSSLFIANNHIM